MNRWNLSLRSVHLFVKMGHSTFAMCFPSADIFQDLLLGIQTSVNNYKSWLIRAEKNAKNENYFRHIT